MYTVTHGTFRTPRGRSVSLSYREDTNDYNALRSCLDEDEYRLAELTLTGTALDVGAHIGGVTVALALGGGLGGRRLGRAQRVGRRVGVGRLLVLRPGAHRLVVLEQRGHPRVDVVGAHVASSLVTGVVVRGGR